MSKYIRENWIVKNERPEEIFRDPKLYYTKEEVEHYAKSSGMRNVQEKIAERIVDIIGIKENAKLLDLGCGTGYTLNIYSDYGFNAYGIDVIPEMAEKAKEKGFNAKQCDMRNIADVFQKDEFDFVVSVSALQWIKESKEIEKAAKAIYFVLKRKGRAVIQFYPQSFAEFKNTRRIFEKNGFDCEELIDNPDNPRKRLMFLVLNKIK